MHGRPSDALAALQRKDAAERSELEASKELIRARVQEAQAAHRHAIETLEQRHQSALEELRAQLAEARDAAAAAEAAAAATEALADAKHEAAVAESERAARSSSALIELQTQLSDSAIEREELSSQLQSMMLQVEEEVAAALELTQPRGLHVPASHPLAFDSHRCSGRRPRRRR